MTFLRVKRARGRLYAYEVENRWHPRLRQPRQRVVRYLGRLDRLRPEALPDSLKRSSVLARLARIQNAGEAQRRSEARALSDAFRLAILAGDRATAARLARRSRRALGNRKFLEEVVVAAAARIGEEWANGRLSVSQEHLATGLLARLLDELNRPYRPDPPAGPVVLLAVPEGEEHTLALLLAEGALRERGYRPLNIGGPAPVGQILRFVEQTGPSALLLSVTLPTHLPAARLVAASIRRRFPSVRVVVGGQAFGPAAREPLGAGVEVVRGSILEHLETWPRTVGRTGGGVAPRAAAPRRTRPRRRRRSRPPRGTH